MAGWDKLIREWNRWVPNRLQEREEQELEMGPGSAERRLCASALIGGWLLTLAHKWGFAADFFD
jgi:hypothetical protein